MLSIQKRAVALQDGISSQYIEKTDAGNVAAAVKHIPVVSLVNEGVFIRGLGSRYSEVPPNDGFFTQVNYIGAFGTTDWTQEGSWVRWPNK